MDNGLKYLGKQGGNRLYECPFCHDTISVEADRFYGRCPACHATLIDYKPAPHQVDFHKSKAKFRLNIGGFGSGKTTMCCAELAHHAMSVPNGRSLITAPVLKQVKEAVIPELIKFLPSWLIEKSTMTPAPYFKLTNGHEILIYTSDDEQKMRSLNLTAFYIEEASRVPISVFTQLQTRLRNPAGIIYDENGDEIGDVFMGMVCSNPEEGWIRSEFLLKSSKVYTSASIDRVTFEKLVVKNPNRTFASFLSSSRDNLFLPHNFLRDLCEGKSPSWVRKYIDCYLDIREGAVYPDFFQCLVPPFPIPKEWERLYGFDKGFKDPTALLCGAVDPKDYTIYIYDEYYVKEQPMTYHAKHIPPYINGYKKMYPIQADPSVKAVNEKDGVSYQFYFQRLCNIWLEPANNNIDFGIEKVRDYMFTGKLKFFSTCDNLKYEASQYVYNDPESAKPDKPVDKDNHLMDCLRYMIARLPNNPNDFHEAEVPVQTWDRSSQVLQKDNYVMHGGVIGGMTLWQRKKKR